jgi:pimeloyl-ACP methyl ester carboxylesterase
MSSKHTVIYIPGIGDDVKGLQSTLIKKWRLYGMEPIIHEVPWMDREAFAPKLERLLARIDELVKHGHTVSLVAASAGAGAAINAFAKRPDKVNGVVCIAGKVNNPESIGDGYRQRSPSFIESAQQVQFSLDILDEGNYRPRIMSRYALFDPIIPRDDSIVLGGVNITVPTFGHSVTIAEQLLLGAPNYLRWLKRLAK